MADIPGFWRSAGRAFVGKEPHRMAGIKRMGDEMGLLIQSPAYKNALAKSVSGAEMTKEELEAYNKVKALSNSQVGSYMGRGANYAAKGAAVGVPLYAGYSMVKASKEATGLQKLGQGDWRYMLPNVATYEAGKAQAMHQMNPEAMGANAPWTVRHPILSGLIPGAAGTIAAGALANKLSEGMSPAAQTLATMAGGGGGYLLGQGLFHYLVNRPRIEASKARFARVGADPAKIQARLQEIAAKNRLLRGVKGVVSPTWAEYDKGYSDMLRAAAYGQPDTAASKGLPMDVLEGARAASSELPLVGALRRGFGGAEGWNSINTARQTLGELGIKER